jgi:hypothetical protein
MELRFHTPRNAQSVTFRTPVASFPLTTTPLVACVISTNETSTVSYLRDVRGHGDSDELQAKLTRRQR